MIVKYGILLQEGQTEANIAKFRVLEEDKNNFRTVILKEGVLVTAGNGSSQKRVTEWATGKIVEWEVRDENVDDSIQVNIINDAITTFNTGRTVIITTERFFAVTAEEQSELGNKPSK